MAARISDKVTTGVPNGILANDEDIQAYEADGVTVVDLLKVNSSDQISIAVDGQDVVIGGTLAMGANSITSTGTISSGAITASGEITANGGIALGDNDKATFGDGDDLKIYHSSSSFIREQGNGGLYIDSDGGHVTIRVNSSEKAVEALNNGAVNLYHDNSEKLATTSTGINVTGTVTATGGNSANWNTAFGWGNHALQSYATETYVGTQISNLVDSSPAALNTLNELAAAIGDDANFSTTVTNNIATKLPLAGGTLTGNLNVTGATGVTTLTASDDITINTGALIVTGAPTGEAIATFSGNTGAYNPADTNGLRIGFNYSGGNTEVAFINSFYGASRSFEWLQATSTSNQDSLMTLTPAGNLSITGTLGVTGATTLTAATAINANIANPLTINANLDGIVYNEVFNVNAGASAGVYFGIVTQNLANSGTIRSGMFFDSSNHLNFINGEAGGAGIVLDDNNAVTMSGDITISKSAATSAATLFITNTGNSTGDKMDIDFTSGTSLRGRIRTEVVGSPYRGTMTFTTALGASETTQLTLGDSAGTATAQFAGDLDVTGQYRQSTAPATYAHANADDLVLGTTVNGSSGMTIVSGTSGYGNIWFSNGTTGTTQYDGYMQYIHSTDTLGFGTAGAARMSLNTTELSVVGDVKASGAFTRTIPNGGYLEGTYNSLGSTVSQTSPIYTIGSNYQPYATTLNNMYGIGHSYHSASFINFTGAAGWGMYAASAGVARIWLGSDNGVISSTGEHYVGAHKVWHAGDAVVAASATNAVRFQSTSHNGTYFLVNNWDNTYWYITSNHSGGTRVDVADNLTAGAKTISGNLTVGNTTNSNIYMTDTDEGFRTLHCNSNRIGFLNSAGHWSAYSTDAGRWECSSGLSVSNGIVNNSAGINYPGTTITGGTSNAIGFRWIAGPNTVNVGVDNAVNIIVGTTSDYRLKIVATNDIGDSLSRLKSLNTYEYTSKDEDTGTVYRGVLAHEVAKLFPNLVTGAKDDPNQLQAVNHAAFTIELIQAMKQLDARLTAIEAHLNIEAAELVIPDYEPVASPDFVFPVLPEPVPTEE